RHPGVSQAAVVACENEAGAKRLVAYVAPEVEGLREFLRQRLPEFMLPAQFLALPELPLTANGKINRQRLPTKTAGASPAARASEPGEPPGLPRRSFTEQRLLAIWQTLLPTAPPDVPFLEAGGDSLTALRLLHAVEREFGREL